MTRAYGAAFDRPAVDAEREVRDVLAAWEARGLLSIDPGEPAGETRSRLRRSRRELAPVGAAACVRRYRLIGSVFEVRYPTCGTADFVDPVLRHLAIDTHSGDVRVDIAEGRDGLEVRVDGMVLDKDLKPEELAPQVKAALLMTAVNRHGFAAYLHSAVLRLNGALLLLPGAPGSGKTCLCLALSRRGFAYLSDEAALLSPDTLRVRAAPVSACVKEGAWRIVEPLYPQLSGLDAHHRVDGKVVKYLPPPGAPGDPALDLGWPVRWLLFPRFVPGSGHDGTAAPPRGGAAPAAAGVQRLAARAHRRDRRAIDRVDHRDRLLRARVRVARRRGRGSRRRLPRAGLSTAARCR